MGIPKRRITSQEFNQSERSEDELVEANQASELGDDEIARLLSCFYGFSIGQPDRS
jgi:hypothetical protein